MYDLVSTYRIQFHKNFNFDDFEKIISYLQKLDVATIYASPVFEAVPGSTHGSDGLDPNKINPETGTEGQLKNISKKPQLFDVPEKGKRSVYTTFFDASFTGDFFKEQIMVPFLSGLLDETIKKRDLKVAFEDGYLC